jgi:hypothetical protein
VMSERAAWSAYVRGYDWHDGPLVITSRSAHDAIVRRDGAMLKALSKRRHGLVSVEMIGGACTLCLFDRAPACWVSIDETSGFSSAASGTRPTPRRRSPWISSGREAHARRGRRPGADQRPRRQPRGAGRPGDACAPPRRRVRGRSRRARNGSPGRPAPARASAVRPRAGGEENARAEGAPRGCTRRWRRRCACVR